MQETRVRSLGQEDPLEKEMATYPSILAWEIPWMEEPGGLLSMGSHRVGHDWSDLAAAAFPRLPPWLSGKESTCQCRRLQSLWVQSLGWEDPLEEKMVTRSSILVWRIPRTKEPGRLQSIGSQRVRHD